jgi:hypothetical protein
VIRKTFLVSFPLCLLLAETSISPSSNLHTEGVPAIPAVLMEELDHYNDIRGASLLDWHPAKSEVLISTRFADVPQIHRVAMPGGARTQLTFFPDRTGSALYRPGTGESFAFSKDTGGGEFYQLFRFDTRSSAITLLTDGKSRNTAPVWSRDESLLAYSSILRNGSGRRRMVCGGVVAG